MNSRWVKSESVVDSDERDGNNNNNNNNNNISATGFGLTEYIAKRKD